MRRNAWFQRHAAAQLAAHSPAPGARVTVFAHSYSARAIFETAKARGWSTVLGQIDPGEEHFAIVRRLEDLRPEYGPPSAKPPVEYFQSWRAECALADRIVVNSQWSREALIKAGIDAERIAVVPLAADDAEGAHRRSYPQRFSVERPLRLLFVGSASVIKGAPELLDAMMRLRDAPVRLLMVGEPGNIPASVTGGAAIEWTGAVPRGDLAAHYGANDVLVFPSHSDGFGMAQVEAQDWGMPVVASRSCGNVVVDGWNGLLLPEVSADAIANAVQALLDAPHRLAEFAAHAVSGPDGMRRLGSSLAQLANLDHASA